MKKSFINCFLLSVLSLEIISCSQKSTEEEVKEFALRFADKVSQNQIDSLKLVYPGIENADSVALNYVEDGIVVNPSENGKEYEIIFSPEARIWVIKNKEKKYSVTNSKGLFAYPEEKKDLATKTGLWDPNLNDEELAKRMNDREFENYIKRIKYLDRKNILIVDTKLTSKDSSRWGESGYYIIKNNTDKTIADTDYRMEFKDELSMPFSETTFKRYSERGQEIPPHGVIKIKGSWSHAGSGHYEEDHHLVGVTILLSQQELQDKFSTFTGKEYQEYLESKAK